VPSPSPFGVVGGVRSRNSHISLSPHPLVPSPLVNGEGESKKSQKQHCLKKGSHDRGAVTIAS
jgi:hypothetical protein